MPSGMGPFFFPRLPDGVYWGAIFPDMIIEQGSSGHLSVTAYPGRAFPGNILSGGAYTTFQKVKHPLDASRESTCSRIYRNHQPPFPYPLHRSPMFLNCVNISFSYPLSDTPVFKEMSCRIPTRGFHALFGPSGVGKTTLIHLITGRLNGYSGEILRPPELTILYSHNLERLPGWSTVGDHLGEIANPSQRSLIPELVSVFGLSPCMDKRFSALSLGQKNRVNLARYLLQDFQILIMDESLANVDEGTRDRIILKIKELFPSRGFIYISHNLSEVVRFCDRILVLRKPGRSPQLLTAGGMDFREAEEEDRAGLTNAMLEIMHAS